jgi:hypothetical protein
VPYSHHTFGLLSYLSPKKSAYLSRVLNLEFLAINSMALLYTKIDGMDEVGERAVFEYFRSLDRGEREERVFRQGHVYMNKTAK